MYPIYFYTLNISICGTSGHAKRAVLACYHPPVLSLVKGRKCNGGKVWRLGTPEYSSIIAAEIDVTISLSTLRIWDLESKRKILPLYKSTVSIMKVKNDCRDFNDYSPNLWRKNIDVLLNIVREIDTTINQRTLIKRLNVFFRMSYQVKSIMTSQIVL